MNVLTGKNKNPAISYYLRSASLALLLLLGLVILSSFLIREHNILQLEHDIYFLESQFKERADRLDNLLGAVTDRVKEMQLIANDKLVEAKTITDFSQVRIFEDIEDGQDGGYFHLDTITPPYSSDILGNLTGTGSIGNRNSEFYQEAYMALNLVPVFRATMNTIHSNAWSYYISANEFEIIYPWVSSREFHFTTKNFNDPCYSMATPENNPDRGQYWTEVYVDAYGKGLMTTCGIPIYEGDDFLGMIGLDLTVDFLNEEIGKFDLRNGRFFIINDKKQVVACPELVSSNQNSVYTLTDALPKEYQDNKLQVDLLPSDKITREGSYTIVQSRMTNAPWRVIYYEPVSDLFKSFFHRIGIKVAIIFGAIIVLIIASILLIHKGNRVYEFNR